MLPAVRPVVLCGAVAPLGDKGALSAIGKQQISPPWEISLTGVTGDVQADLKNHGGPEKALHHYPIEHYAYWTQLLGPAPIFSRPGAFGENISTTGWTEANTHIGDIVRFGDAVLQVSQGRQPCWKLNLRFGRPDMARLVQRSGLTGWYYRVLTPGRADATDRFVLVERLRPQWPVARVLRLLYSDTLAFAELGEMAELPELAEGWRRIAARRLEQRRVEDWLPRLERVEKLDPAER